MPTHIVGFSGSLRRDSYNTMLLRAAQHLLPDEAALTIIDLNDIPLYNEDLRAGGTGFPDPVAALRSAVAAADAVLIASPEYNHSVTGVTKNAIDWLSRTGDDHLEPLAWKWVAIVGASTGMFGPARSMEHLRTVLAAANSYVVNRPEVLVNSARNKFSSTGDLTDAGARRFYGELLAQLVQLAVSKPLGAQLPASDPAPVVAS